MPYVVGRCQPRVSSPAVAFRRHGWPLAGQDSWSLWADGCWRPVPASPHVRYARKGPVDAWPSVPPALGGMVPGPLWPRRGPSSNLPRRWWCPRCLACWLDHGCPPRRRWGAEGWLSLSVTGPEVTSPAGMSSRCLVAVAAGLQSPVVQQKEHAAGPTGDGEPGGDRLRPAPPEWPAGGYLVDSASSHMLVSKIKPCMSKYKQTIP